MELVDLTHTFQNDMPVYPGDPETKLEHVAKISIDGFNDHKVTTCLHVGTHIDAPLHMIEGGKALSDISIESFFGRGCVIDARGKKQIDSDLLEENSVREGDIVVVATGMYKKYGSKEYFEDYPMFTKEFAEKLVERKVKIVCMDTVSPDNKPYEIHKILLKNDVLIIENLTDTEKIIDKKDFQITALPTKMFADAAPVRVIAKINHN